MNTFEHFILTRFNVPLKTAAPAAPAKGLDPAWLARRFDLFERICLASVDRQVEGAFQWLVFLDWATPMAFKERMAALTVRHEFLRPVYCSQFDEETALAEIRRREEPGKIRITTNLDNDDAIHPRLTEHIQREAEKQVSAQDLAKGFFITFPVGCIERKGDFYLQRDAGNPFASYVSAPETDRTVLGCDHRALAGVAPVVQVMARPLWCQVLHDDNAAVPLTGVYWPWGGDSEFAPYVTNGFRRSALWQAAEVARSAARHWLGR